MTLKHLLLHHLPCFISDAYKPCFTWRVLDVGNYLIAIGVHGHKITGVSVQHQPPETQTHKATHVGQMIRGNVCHKIKNPSV